MYCSECGAKATGKFCSGCGHRLDSAVVVVEPAEQELVGDWAHEISYETLLAHRDVRERIARAAAESTAGLTGEQFLAWCEKALTPLTSGVPLPLAATAKFIQPLYAKMGVRTGKERIDFFPQPIGTAIVAVLCSLARHGQKLLGVQSAGEECHIEAELPSDIFALAGSMTITIRREAGGARIEASTNIPGQMFDWGKSTRRLEKILSEVRAAA